MKYLLPLLLVLTFSCTSSKKNIGNAATSIHEGASKVTAEATYGRGQLEGVLGMIVDEVVVKAVKAAIEAFENIEDIAEEVHANAEKITANLGGVKDKGWSIWTKLVVGGGMIATIAFAAMRFGAGGFLLTLGSGLLGRVTGLFKKGS